jgi:hypothetical protein
MKTKIILTLALFTVLVLAAGCSKKENPVPPAPGQSQETETNTPDAVKENKPLVETETVEKLINIDIDADIAKSIDEIKVQIAEMNVTSLRNAAIKYKDKLVETQEGLKTLTREITTVSSDEKTAFLENIQALTSSLMTLKERHRIYLDAIQAKGGEIKDLMPAQ